MFGDGRARLYEGPKTNPGAIITEWVNMHRCSQCGLVMGCSGFPYGGKGSINYYVFPGPDEMEYASNGLVTGWHVYGGWDGYNTDQMSDPILSGMEFH